MSGDAPTRGRLQSIIEALFAIDARSLAVVRIALASLLLIDLVDRSRDLVAHYTDFGVLPRSANLEKLLDPWNLSIHMGGGKAPFEAALFLIAAGFAIALLVGYRTRLSTFVSWFLLISLQGRNPLVLQGGDVLFRLLFFWSMFLPLGQCWSVDRLRLADDRRPRLTVCSVGTAGFLLQVAFVYWFAASLKTDASWRTDGTALARALAIEQLDTSFGIWLRGFPDVMKALSFATIWLESIGPYFAFSPVLTVPLRLAAIAAFVSFHLGIAAAMPLGLFQYVCIAGWLAFLPGAFWDRLGSWLPSLTWLRPATDRVRPKPPALPTEALALFLILYVFLWNLRETNPSRFDRWPPRSSNWIGQLLRLDQKWDMFAPKPLGEDGWYVMPAALSRGETVDLFRDGAPVDWAKPPLVSALYKNQRWQKYMMNLWLVNHSMQRLYYGRYLCRSWNARHPDDQVLTFEMYFMREAILDDGSKLPPEKTLIWKHRCFD